MTQVLKWSSCYPCDQIVQDLTYHWDYIYEPEASEVLDILTQEGVIVYQAVVENIACEQAARMVAMKAASDNAENSLKNWN